MNKVEKIPMKSKEKNKGSLKRLFKMMKPMLPLLIIVVVSVVIAAVFQIIGPVFFKDLTSEATMQEILVVDPLTGLIDVDVSLLLIKVGIIAAIYVVMCTFQFIADFTVSKVTGRIMYRLRNDVKLKLDKLPLEFFEDRKSVV